MDPDIIIPLAGMATGIILGFPLIRAVIVRLEGGRRSSPDEIAALRQEVHELRGIVEEMAEMDTRMTELEERADFAERLLTRDRGKPELPAE